MTLILFVKGTEKATSHSMSIFNNIRLYVNTLMLHMASDENMEAQVKGPRRY